MLIVTCNMVFDLDKTQMDQQVNPIFNGKGPVCKALAKQLLEPRFTDWKFVCEGEEIPCHRVLLASQSPVFRRMFESGFKENNTSQTIIKVQLQRKLNKI